MLLFLLITLPIVVSSRIVLENFQYNDIEYIWNFKHLAFYIFVVLVYEPRSHKLITYRNSEHV